ncbi:NUDIX hydrolase [Sphingobacterium paucimobilis]|uniref:8-oxo-dGTP diphosphatase n=1 Tax=Sphingobacterium paucimobilis HER1398 TaxID=1346330 RepID=U2J8I7_9SPHI|nr:NUDIX domain-containing protein [Sphingobacterium paucimobilis]ERJ61254.1 hypothetical protein M472_21100 [Sphingobacterium paucimobilis HER1398]
MLSKITVALAIITNDENEMLALRKKDASYYTLPGGKIELGETPIDALIRELNEELDIIFNKEDFSLAGTHMTRAANEANTIVEGFIFCLTVPFKTTVSPHAEIEEKIWLSKENYKDYNLAHLLKEFALPRWLDLNVPKDC